MEKSNTYPMPPPLEEHGLDPVQWTPAAAGPGRPSRMRRALRMVGAFFLGQGALQGVQLLASVFLVRHLSVEAYAQFGLAYGFQMTMGTLMDLGFASSIVPLVGERRDDLFLVGRYVRAAKHLRDRFFWILSPVAVVAFMALMYRHHWSWGLQLLLIGSVLLALHSSGRVSYYAAPLFLFGRLRDYYVPLTIAAGVRLCSYLCLSAAGALNSSLAAGLNAVNLTVNGSLLQRKSNRHMHWPEHADPVIEREMVRFILPAAPAIIFSAFQSQISLFLISIFGSSTSMAQVAALGRLGQLFSVFMTFNIIVIEPYVARLQRERLLNAFFTMIAASVLCCVPVVLLAFLLPTPFLRVLGEHYSNLGSSVGWVVLAACINHVSGLMWIMNRSRRWVFWSGSLLEIGLMLIVQTTYIVVIGVHTTQQAVFLAFISSFCNVIAHGYVTLCGFASKEHTAHGKPA